MGSNRAIHSRRKPWNFPPKHRVNRSSVMSDCSSAKDPGHWQPGTCSKQDETLWCHPLLVTHSSARPCNSARWKSSSYKYIVTFFQTILFLIIFLIQSLKYKSGNKLSLSSSLYIFIFICFFKVLNLIVCLHVLRFYLFCVALEI